MKTSDAPRVYNSVLDVFKKTWKNEGIRGLQKGLAPAVSCTVCATLIDGIIDC